MRCSIIPARGGSKRVPRKNVRKLDGVPLIVYSIRHAIAAGSDQVLVTTDDDEIAEVSSGAGAEVIVRPVELAGDRSSTIDAVIHALQQLESEHHRPSHVAVLQPTCPFRPVECVTQAFEMMEESGCDSVATYRRMGFYHPNRMKRIGLDGRTEPYCETEIEAVPVSELPEAYQRDGYVYACRAELPLEQNTLFGNDHRAIVIPGDRIINIDDETDWLIAEDFAQKMASGNP